MRAFVLTLALFAAPAAAVIIDPATPGQAFAQRSIESEGVVTSSDDFGTYTVGDASVTVDAAPVAKVVAKAKTYAGSTYDAGASGNINYQYLVKVAATANAPNVILNLVTIKGIVTLSSTGLALGNVQAFSGANVDGTSDSYYEPISSYYTGPSSVSHAFQIGGAARYTATLDNGDGTESHIYIGNLGLFAGARAYAGGGDVSTMIDPVITINGGALQNAGLNGPASLLLSSGISNLAAVPEPANWALMIGGFGLLGAVSRRRRAVALQA